MKATIVCLAQARITRSNAVNECVEDVLQQRIEKQDTNNCNNGTTVGSYEEKAEWILEFGEWKRLS
jgi:hypothetical protein